MEPQDARNRTLVILSVALLLPLFGVGCATKKYVRNTVAPMETHLGTLDQKSTQNANDIRDVDQKAEKGISEASNKADQANQAASKADQDAQDANQLAQKGVDQAQQVKQDLTNIDKFQPVTTETVLFKINRSDLTDDDKKALDEVADKVQSLSHYMIQVQGFTDTSGPKEYNLELSQRRADAVVRYLTLEKKIPQVRISELGLGEEAPTAPNKTLKGRKQNRRAEVTVLAPQAMAASQQPASTATLGPH